MQIKPVEHPVNPGYPDKYDEKAKQALAAAQPRRWVAAPLAAGLVATVALGLSGCGDTYVTEGEPVQTPTGMETSAWEYLTDGEPTQAPTPIEPQTADPTTTQKPTTRTTATEFVIMGDMPVPTQFQARPVAADTRIPLFEFGEGTGAFGCVSVSAPVFLSEEEAFAILSAAFAEAGLDLRPNGKILRSAALPVTDIYRGTEEGKQKTKRGSLTTDGTLENLPVEFVSAEDVQAWHADTGMWSSVTLYPVKQSAKVLAENNPGLVVFYDPMGSADYENLWSMQQKAGESDEAYGARWDAARAKLDREARALSEKQLRQQAAAFLQWLSAEASS